MANGATHFFSIPCLTLEMGHRQTGEEESEHRRGKRGHQAGIVERGSSHHKLVVVVALIELVDDVGMVDDQTNVVLT